MEANYSEMMKVRVISYESIERWPLCNWSIRIWQCKLVVSVLLESGHKERLLRWTGLDMCHRRGFLQFTPVYKSKKFEKSFDSSDP